MTLRKGLAGLVLALAAVAALAVASTVSAKPSQSFKAAVVTDIGGLGDKGFNDLCAKGLADAKTQLKIQGRVFISKSDADYVPNLSTVGRQKYDVVITCGFLIGADTLKAAKRFPGTAFATIDYGYGTKGAKNLRGLVFAEQEAGYLAGVAAATASPNGVSFVGGQAVPAVVAFRAGFLAGAKATKRGIRTQAGYSETFTDQAKCKEMAINQFSRGSGAVFAAAGGCGLGALQAAKEQRKWGLGVDSDQYFLGTHILTSATKRVDVAVFRTIRDAFEGTYAGNTDVLFTVKNGGVGFGRISTAYKGRAALQKKLTAVANQIKAGTIKPPRK